MADVLFTGWYLHQDIGVYLNVLQTLYDFITHWFSILDSRSTPAPAPLCEMGSGLGQKEPSQALYWHSLVKRDSEDAAFVLPLLTCYQREAHAIKAGDTRQPPAALLAFLLRGSGS